MFDNIGGKIKGLAKFVTWVGILASVIVGIGMISISTPYGHRPSVPAGILTMVAGSLGAWVSSLVLYGFGELIEQTTKINQALTKPEEKPDAYPNDPPELPKQSINNPNPWANP